MSEKNKIDKDLIQYKSNNDHNNNNVNMNDNIGDLRIEKDNLYFDSYSGEYSIPLSDNRLAAAISKSINVYEFIEYLPLHRNNTVEKIANELKDRYHEDLTESD
jgi:hypothetical protein